MEMSAPEISGQIQLKSLFHMLQCVDANECRSNPCGPGAVCSNEIAGFTCSCPPGTSGSDPYNKGCTFDKTPVGPPSPPACTSSPCGKNTICQDTAGGGYICLCKEGYTGQPFRGCTGKILKKKKSLPKRGII